MKAGPDWRESLRDAKRVVVKVGSSLLTKEDEKGPRVDAAFARRLIKQIVALREQGIEVTLVSSGAVAAGCADLGLTERPTDVADLQALAAVGQRHLMTLYHNALKKAGLAAGQVLLTRQDVDDRLRYLNLRNCIARLHERACLPILNENDTVAVEEIRFGDNDMLAALLCVALGADALVLLTGVDGVLDEDGQVLPELDRAVDAVVHAKRGSSRWGQGGMLSKLEAARVASEAGEPVVIANGRTKDILAKVLSGESVGTLVLPAQRKLDGRSRWIGVAARPSGGLQVDEGAVRALVERGKSLLATGLTGMTGRFERGDIVIVRDPKGREIARGLTNYGAEELRLIQGKRTSEFAKLLGRSAYSTVIHRNNLVLATDS